MAYRKDVVAWCRKNLRRQLKLGGLRHHKYAAQSYQIYTRPRTEPGYGGIDSFSGLRHPHGATVSLAQVNQETRWGDFVLAAQPGEQVTVLVYEKTRDPDQPYRTAPHGRGEISIHSFVLKLPKEEWFAKASAQARKKRKAVAKAQKLVDVVAEKKVEMDAKQQTTPEGWPWMVGSSQPKPGSISVAVSKETLAKLSEVAKDQFRTPEGQAAYFLTKCVAQYVAECDRGKIVL